MSIKPVELERFSLHGILGEGADLQVYSGVDTDTGRPVVIKRPHPSLIQRHQHQDVERSVERVIELRERLGDSTPHVPKILGYSRTHKDQRYFEDGLGEDYLVVVQERARGIPLVGSPVDGIKGLPIGLPHNLFALHPLVPHARRDGFIIARDILNVAEAVYHEGYLPLDLRPENVFFEPRSATISVIDLGDVQVEGFGTRRNVPLDLHDFYLELLKWYTTPSMPPVNTADYGIADGMDSASMFARDLAAMRREFSVAVSGPLRQMALGIIDRVKRRGYPSPQEFRIEFGEYLCLAGERYKCLSDEPSLVATWRAALERLDNGSWHKFLFDPKVDLEYYSPT